MNLKTAEMLSWHMRDAEVIEEYSGRNMYGKTTAAIVFDDWCDLLESVSRVTSETEGLDTNAFAKEIGQIKQDSMGRRIVVY